MTFANLLSIYDQDNALSSRGLKTVKDIYETDGSFRSAVDAKIAEDDEFGFWSGIRKREPIIIQRKDGGF